MQQRACGNTRCTLGKEDLMENGLFLDALNEAFGSKVKTGADAAEATCAALLNRGCLRPLARSSSALKWQMSKLPCGWRPSMKCPFRYSEAVNPGRASLLRRLALCWIFARWSGFRLIVRGKR